MSQRSKGRQASQNDLLQERHRFEPSHPQAVRSYKQFLESYKQFLESYKQFLESYKQYRALFCAVKLGREVKTTG
ncbi:MAG: hypothetical protein CMLOHMNK_02048 [Steroidobacteraceae bacterium]|nr:hypothetical protein [Steroidobacteraceae bacterium]